MANNHEQAGGAERLVRASRDFHIAVGAVALAGSVLLQAEALSFVAALAGVSFLGHQAILDFMKDRSGRRKPRPA